MPVFSLALLAAAGLQQPSELVVCVYRLPHSHGRSTEERIGPSLAANFINTFNPHRDFRIRQR